jgi:O-antigen/teichoic acid export membrane protein
MVNLSEKSTQKSVKKNYFYNLFYQIFTIIVPLVVTPYVSRVLKVEGIGQNSFVLSIVSYFTLFAALGFGYYAQREIARCLNDKEKQSKVFWEILIVRLFSTSLALIVYFS